MASDDQQDLVEQILNPQSEDADHILNELGLSELPSREQVNRAIEEKLLLPKETIPAHWLPHYQV